MMRSPSWRLGFLGLTALSAAVLLSPLAFTQQKAAERGGQEEFGHYDIAPDWNEAASRWPGRM